METPSSSESADNLPVVTAAPAALVRPAFYRNPALLIALAALLLGAWLWYDNRTQMSALREDLARRLAAAEVISKEGKTLATQVAEATRDAQVKLGVLESKLQESQNQQIALEALYQELSRSRDESLLADIEQTLLVANQQLQVAGNVKSALIALYAADGRLARMDRPQLSPLRKVIARDIERLKLAPYVDVVGLSARLDVLLGSIDKLPLAMEVRPAQPSIEKKADDSATVSAWRRFASELWQDMRDLVRIERMDKPDVALLTPSQTFFLRENLKLRLLGARLALLARDERSYKADLNAARDWLQQYFDGRDKAVANLQAAVRQLNESDISIELPDVAASLDAVRNYRLTRERPR